MKYTAELTTPLTHHDEYAGAGKPTERRQVRDALDHSGRRGQRAQKERAQDGHARERRRHVLGRLAPGPHRRDGGAAALELLRQVLRGASRWHGHKRERRKG